MFFVLWNLESNIFSRIICGYDLKCAQCLCVSSVRSLGRSQLFWLDADKKWRRMTEQIFAQDTKGRSSSQMWDSQPAASGQTTAPVSEDVSSSRQRTEQKMFVVTLVTVLLVSNSVPCTTNQSDCAAWLIQYFDPMLSTFERRWPWQCHSPSIHNI